jgi:hypothetical protein
MVRWLWGLQLRIYLTQYSQIFKICKVKGGLKPLNPPWIATVRECSLNSPLEVPHLRDAVNCSLRRTSEDGFGFGCPKLHSVKLLGLVSLPTILSISLNSYLLFTLKSKGKAISVQVKLVRRQ